MPPGLPFDTLTVLIADDDQDMRTYLRSCLVSLGVPRVIETADGANALRHARAAGVGLVITDLVMPGLDGLALCDALKSDEATRHIPVILVSGEIDAPTASRANGFLVKPFNAARLRAAVADALIAPV